VGDVLRFDKLANALPANAAQPQAAGGLPKAFDLTPAEVDGYVKPRFVVTDWPKDAAVLLIEAPGAVGKSAAARAISAAMNWPLVYAEKAQVGSYSLSGLIHDSLGFQSTYMADVANAQAGVVIDSLDEALFRAGTDNFFAFIDNVQKVAGAIGGGAERSPSIVLFSRSEAAELVKLKFLDSDLPLATAHLDFFTRTEAQAFIISYLNQRFQETKRPEYNVYRSSPTPYERLRDLRLKQVARLLARDENVDLNVAWPDLSDFLGYAPVLTAIGESLAVSNPNASRNVTFDAQTQNDLLAQINTSILVREQGKFRDNMQDKLRAISPATAADFDPANLYSVEEQCARLLSRVEGIQLVHTSPLDLPEALRPEYETAANQFMGDHPFLRQGKEFASVVFADYVRARAATDVRITAELQSAPPVRSGSVGPFYARFLADTCAPDQTLKVPESQVEAVIASWEQEQELADTAGAHNRHVSITLSGGTGFVQCDPLAAENDSDHWLEFEVTDVSGVYQLGSRIRRRSVFSEGLVLGERGQHLEVGPEVVLLSNEISIEAESMRVAGSASAMNVVFYAPQIVANYLGRVDADTSSLVLLSEDVAPILQPFTKRIDGHVPSGRHRVAVSHFVDLRNVLMAFKPSVKGARFVSEYVDSRIIRGSDFRRSLFADLEARGVFRRESPWVYLETSKLTDLGFGLMELKSGAPSDAMLTYLGGVIMALED
jgi:hypothetical protein